VAASNQGEKNSRQSHLFVQPVDEENYDSSSDVLLEQVQSDPYNLSYTCFLIPRTSFQPLTSDLIYALPRWMATICAPLDWTLKFIKVTPDYFQWALSVPPTVSTGNIIQKIRFQTTELILTRSSPTQKEDVVSDGFWTKGYLTITGVQPDPREIIERYIKLIRQQ